MLTVHSVTLARLDILPEDGPTRGPKHVGGLWNLSF